MHHLWYLAFTLISFTYFSQQAVPDDQPHLGESGEESDNCTCVPFYSCNNGKFNTSGEVIINIRKNDDNCEHYMDVCCKKEEQVRAPQTTTSSPAAVKRGCGYRHSNGIGFKIAGDNENESQFGEFPWMVSVLNNNWYECGGSLIHPQVVITAAHCFNNTAPMCNYKVRAGEWDYQHNNEPYPYQERDLKSVTIHHEYNIDNIFNDIAILILESPLEITDHVNVICLPQQNAFIDAGTCYSTGWNKNIVTCEKQVDQTILKKVTHFQLPRATCAESLNLSFVKDEYDLPESIMCAMTEVKSGICRGDTGSPLVCPIKGEKNIYYQAGIVVTACFGKDTPVFYVNVSNLREWIDEQMYNNGFEFSGYLPYEL